MYRFLIILLIGIALIGCHAGAPTPMKFAHLEGKASYVIDGDSFYFSYSQGKVKIKLYGIAAPEMKQDQGFESYEYLRELIHEHTVDVEFLDTDAHGNWIANVNMDHENIQSKIMENGHAWCEISASNTGLKTLEIRARNQKIGLWKTSNPVPPWEWKAGH